MIQAKKEINMGLNLAEVQQKIDNLITHQQELLKKSFKLFYSPNPEDVEMEQIDKDGMLKKYSIPNYAKVSGLSAPVGAIVMWPGKEAPENWEICNGKELKREVFPQLFHIAVQGGEQPAGAFGKGDNVNTFTLPDMTKNTIPGINYIIRTR